MSRSSWNFATAVPVCRSGGDENSVWGAKTSDRSYEWADLQAERSFGTPQPELLEIAPEFRCSSQEVAPYL